MPLKNIEYLHNKEYSRDGRAPIPEKESTSKVMSANKHKNTKPELMVRRALWNNGIKGYRLHWKIPGKPDIAFPGRKIAIFINGCFWHRCPHCQLGTPKSNSEFWSNKFEKNITRDKKKIQLLDEMGWSTMVLWECSIKNDLSGAVSKIRELLTLKST